MRKLISVHTPKAAGTSIRKILSDAFGDTFVADYRDDPADPLSERHLNPPRYFARNRVLAEGVNCIHGHFHPGQFRLDDEFLFTILRHPIDNVISIYTFWKSDRSNPTGLHAYFLANELDVLQLAQLPLIRHLYSYSYFGGFDMERFDAIGDMKTGAPRSLPSAMESESRSISQRRRMSLRLAQSGRSCF